MAGPIRPEEALDGFLEKLDSYIELKITNAAAHAPQGNPDRPPHCREAPAYHKMHTALADLLISVTTKGTRGE